MRSTSGAGGCGVLYGSGFYLEVKRGTKCKHKHAFVKEIQSQWQEGHNITRYVPHANKWDEQGGRELCHILWHGKNISVKTGCEAVQSILMIHAWTVTADLLGEMFRCGQNGMIY